MVVLSSVFWMDPLSWLSKTHIHVEDLCVANGADRVFSCLDERFPDLETHDKIGKSLVIRSHFGPSTQSARSVLFVFTLPSCSLMATAVDEATIVQAIMHDLASGEAIRQVVAAAAASAILRTHRGDQRCDGLHLSIQEKLKAVAQDFFGHEVGISQVVKHLRLNVHADLAKAVTA